MSQIGSIPAHEDDLGNRWIIEAGDPGRDALEAAKELRLKEPAMPHEVLVGRPPFSADWREFESLVEKDAPMQELRRLYVANQIRQHLRKEWPRN